jgi:hypothetical protein
MHGVNIRSKEAAKQGKGGAEYGIIINNNNCPDDYAFKS